MENFSDKLRACILALFVHVFCVAVFFVGLMWTTQTRPIELPGPVIEAELVGVSAAPKPQATHHPRAKPKAPPPKQPEPAKQPDPTPQPPSQPQRNDRVDREKVADMANQAEQAKRAQEERHRQEQVLLQEQQREQRERMQQLQDVKRQREAADRRLKLEKQKLAQLMDLEKQNKTVPAEPVAQAEQAKTGSNGTDNNLDAQYFAAIQNAVTDSWLRPDSAVQGLRCMLHIVQIPGGDVISVQVLSPCNADPLTRNSIEQAVKRAAPLPYKGYESQFRREINFNFTYDG